MGTQSNTHPPYHTCAPLRIALLFLLALLTNLSAAAQTIVSATTIPLLLPSAIVFDPQGNLYLAETNNHVIRKVDTSGHITTIAGTSTQGFSGDGGPAVDAQLDSPQGLALDAAQNLYIADTHNHRVRRLNLTTGIITTMAGTTSAGFDGDNGPATNAHLNLPTALALDTTGNLYLADTSNHRIRRIAPSGTITTVAGNGTQGFSGDNGLAVSASIDSPTGLVADSVGNLYLADTHNHRIRRIDATTGQITTIAGTGTVGQSGDGTPALNATLALPHGLTIDASRNLYLADTENNRIRRIDATTGIITTIAGNGTQTFSGDSGLATTSSLDTPRSVSISPTGLSTIADTGNQRIRQISADNTIHTIAGLGLSTPGTLSLSAPSVIAYGSGQITASLSTPTPATGPVTFLDTTNGIATTLGTVMLAGNTATLNTATLPAGQHSITATYSGDTTHPSTQSSTLSLTITPQQLTASITPGTLLYGQPVPALTATLTGLLSQDATSLLTSFTTLATTLSPAGSYPILATLTGPAAGNYTLLTVPANLSITPAPTITILSTSATTIDPGTALTVTTNVASTTIGNPTGTVTLLDGTNPIFTSPVSSNGNANFTDSTLVQGSHTLTIRYSGDNNFLPSTSIPSIIGVGTPPITNSSEFTIATTGVATQTISSGSSASFGFSVQVQGTTLASPITLAASGLPNLATASFSPNYLPPGVTPGTFVLTIATPQTTSLNQNITSPFRTLAFVLFSITGLVPRLRYRRSTRYISTFLAAALITITMSLCTGCGDRIYTGSQSTTASKPYAITVTGTATTPTGSILQHSATVTLILQSPS